MDYVKISGVICTGCLRTLLKYAKTAHRRAVFESMRAKLDCTCSGISILADGNGPWKILLPSSKTKNIFLICRTGTNSATELCFPLYITLGLLSNSDDQDPGISPSLSRAASMCIVAKKNIISGVIVFIPSINKLDSMRRKRLQRHTQNDSRNQSDFHSGIFKYVLYQCFHPCSCVFLHRSLSSSASAWVRGPKSTVSSPSRREEGRTWGCACSSRASLRP